LHAHPSCQPRTLGSVFNLQGSEIIIVLLLALVVLGPEKLPDAMRKMGQAYAELKKMSTGFQNEFRAAIDEPMREIKDTANVLRDSADFTKLQSGERDAKPKSAEMAPADATDVPVADVPTFESVTDDAEGGPVLAADSEPPPFESPPERTTAPTAVPTPPPPFTGMSAATVDPESGLSDGPTAPESNVELPNTDHDDETDTTR
jgi:sec-independent protein translocase protein TatB